MPARCRKGGYGEAVAKRIAKPRARSSTVLIGTNELRKAGGRMGRPLPDAERDEGIAAAYAPGSAPTEDGSALRAGLRNRARRMADDERSSKGGPSGSARSKWYVVQVVSGKEHRVCELLEHHVGAGVIEECFCPAYATQRKVKGEWQECQTLLFPGYVIVVTRDATELKARLGGVTEFTRLLSLGGRFTALTGAERAWICAYTQQGERVMPMSMAVMEGDQVRVVQGPLLGQEALIDHVDRRRSTAYIEFEMFGRRIKTKIGLGVVAKKSQPDDVWGDNQV